MSIQRSSSKMCGKAVATLLVEVVDVGCSKEIMGLGGAWEDK